MRNIVIAGALLAATSPVAATTIFDSQALGEPLCTEAAYTCVTNTRDSYYNFAAVVHFTADTTIAQFGVYAAVGDPQIVQFDIFDSEYNNGSGVVGTGGLLFSQSRYFKVHGLGFIYTDPMSFTFLAGHTYDIGVLGTGERLAGRYVFANNPDVVAPAVTDPQLTTGAITEYAANANIGYYAFDPSAPATTGFVHPFTGGYTNSAGYIQLNSVAVPVINDVPEPATWALLVAGFGLVGMAARRRKTVRA